MGALCHSGDDGKENDDWEWELDDETKAEIVECREGIKRETPRRVIILVSSSGTMR